MTSAKETLYAALAVEDLRARTKLVPRKNATAVLAQMWNDCPDAETFYRRLLTGHMYLHDLSTWHSSGSIDFWFEVVYEQLRDRPRSLVLDYGAGIGSYSLQAAGLGHVVHACDVNEILREYTKWRASRHSLDSIAVMAYPWEVEYDIILCMDVIEHLPEPEEFPAYAAGLLKPGGTLICTWTFHDSGGLHPMHHGPWRRGPFEAALLQHFKMAQAGWPVVLTRRS